MSEKITGNGKHLTLDDRIVIEKSLDGSDPIRSIAGKTGKTPSAISREIRRNRTMQPHNTFNESANKCALRATCKRRNVCDPETKVCKRPCNSCGRCNSRCPDFEPISYHCALTDKAPFVCNGCGRKCSCRLDKFYYRATAAHRRYTTTLKESREGLNITEEELAELDAVVSPLILQGQSPYTILRNHPEIALSEKTIYNYIDAGAFSVKTLDLQKKVSYKPRHVRKSGINDTGIFAGRTYQDYLRLLEEHPETRVVEMDTVLGREGSRKVLLTMHLCSCSFMLAFLLDTKEAKMVNRAFDRMEHAIGTLLFSQFFPVVLTDRGTEFSNPDALECGERELIRTSIYYCDPMCSWQKPHCEKNHEYIRKICPKGTSFDHMTQRDVNLMMSHINSSPRESLCGLTPFTLAKMMLPSELLEFLGQSEIAPDEVILKPDLLRKKL